MHNQRMANGFAGLDILRSIAILLVIYDHSFGFLMLNILVLPATGFYILCIKLGS